MLYFFGSFLFYFALLFFFTSRSFRKPEGGRMPVLESDNNTPPQVKYDIFVSFRGEDVRGNFLSHLTEAFVNHKIHTFVDDKLKTGEDIWSSLVAAIHASSMSLIIFSPDYASSRWCLKELVTILECSKKYGRLVIPVFYNVQPTHVRHQSGSYENAFTQHRKNHKTEVQLWRGALTTCADLSGIGYSKFRNDAVMVKYIVNYVKEKMVKPPLMTKRLFGITERIATVESLIRKEPKVTQVVGIWGMGGIGKTTLAEEIFNKLQSEYEASYFLASGRAESESEIVSLKKEVFSTLLKDCDVKIDTPNSLPENIVRRIRATKVLVVLDDVKDFDYIEQILGTLDNFGKGSRILLTTRDENVLDKANEKYRLRELSFQDAFDLFISKVKHQTVAKGLIDRVVNYAQGIPLVLKVLSNVFSGKNNEQWVISLKKLDLMYYKKIYGVLKLSFDDLEFKEQEIFLDLACFFLRRHEPVNVSNLESLLKDESDGSIAIELGRLKDKTLLTISGDNIVSMHDILQEMAWKIIEEDSSRHIRLWDSDDVWKALQKSKVEAIRSMRIDLLKIKETELVADQFAKMSELKFLLVESGNLHQHAEWFQSLKSKLRFLCWPHYPLKSLPRNFHTEELVILKLKGSSMEQLWEGKQNLVSLKEVDLSSSSMLTMLPDFSKATNLEVLILKDCGKLTSLHTSIFSLPKHEVLNLNDCKSLTICASDLRLLFLSKTMIELRLSNNLLEELPSSFGHHSKLKLLDLSGNRIERLPSSFSNFKKLLHLSLRHCHSLKEISGLPPSLEILDAFDCGFLWSVCNLPKCLNDLIFVMCSLTTLPELPLSLKTLEVSWCSSLRDLPELPPSLKTLNVSGCYRLVALPKLPSSLEILDVNRCLALKSLPELPVSLQTLIATDCSLLNVVLFPATMEEQLKENKKSVWFNGCRNLNSDCLKAIELNGKMSVIKFAQNEDDVIYVYPERSVPQWFEYMTTNNNIIIDDLCFPVLGFIFCLVFRNLSIFKQEYGIQIVIIDGEHIAKIDDICWLQGKSNQVYLRYDKRISDFLTSKAKHLARFEIRVVLLEFRGTNQIAVKQNLVKGFGLHPIRTSTYDNLVQEMKLRFSQTRPIKKSCRLYIQG